MSLFGLDDPSLSNTDRQCILDQLSDEQKAQLEAAKADAEPFGKEVEL